MKTPRFFITLAACAVVFTIASSLYAPVIRSSSAGTLPVLRVDPRAGDPDQPGAGYRELPYIGMSESSGADRGSTLTRPLPPPATLQGPECWWNFFRDLVRNLAFGRYERWKS